ncbi:uncharacterized protein LOC111278588 isoform X2 [Durio zibethinus]|uniref:Uncharacterized protein LOC111278588 isoform X2 n=1 Tax=Durio zibethinus TaxID=66656 RepID=A0A6P5WYG2_DURZI|nr:uncharacterized protein LOC111278588 isoform X2 [Durio zibethinus]
MPPLILPFLCCCKLWVNCEGLEMATEVSCSLARELSGHVEEQPQIHAGNSDSLITKDLLGSLSKADIQLQPLKVQTQKFSLHKSPLSESASNCSPDGKNKNWLPNTIQDSKLQNLNFPPISFFEDMTSVDLKLLQSSTPSSYQSVCTLDKVKYALERAEKETMKKRSSAPEPPSSPPASSSTPGMFAAACPGCLLYVIASKTNPRCPRCNSIIPSSLAVKKPRIDLNASF